MVLCPYMFALHKSSSREVEGDGFAGVGCFHCDGGAGLRGGTCRSHFDAKVIIL